MAIIKWTPFREIDQMRREMDRMFDDFFTGRRMMLPSGDHQPWLPSVDLVDSEKEFTLKFDLPGLEANDLEIEANASEISIKGERKEEKEIKRENYYYKERSFGGFSRVVPLPSEIKPEEVKSSFKNGVLEITAPKVAPSKPKLPIKVQIS